MEVREKALPAAELEKLISELNRTPHRHWHVFLEDNQDGALELVLRTGERVSLKKFELALT
jgi:hypothetical protein